MALAQQKFREIIFELLYSQDLAGGLKEDQIPFLMQHHAVTKKNLYRAEEQKNAVAARLGEIDQKIAAASRSYDFERISRVEKNILRLAVFELCHDKSVPPKVAISEAIRLAKKFAAPEGAAFVNAILDEIYQGQTS